MQNTLRYFLELFLLLGNFSIVVNEQIFNKQSAIWSHFLVASVCVRKPFLFNSQLTLQVYYWYFTPSTKPIKVTIWQSNQPYSPTMSLNSPLLF